MAEVARATGRRRRRAGSRREPRAPRFRTCEPWVTLRRVVHPWGRCAPSCSRPVTRRRVERLGRRCEPLSRNGRRQLPTETITVARSRNAGSMPLRSPNYHSRCGSRSVASTANGMIVAFVAPPVQSVLRSSPGRPEGRSFRSHSNPPPGPSCRRCWSWQPSTPGTSSVTSAQAMAASSSRRRSTSVPAALAMTSIAGDNEAGSSLDDRASGVPSSPGISSTRTSASHRGRALPGAGGGVTLRPKLLRELTPGTRVVSFYWDMGEWAPDRTLTLPDRPLHLWTIPRAA